MNRAGESPASRCGGVGERAHDLRTPGEWLDMLEDLGVLALISAFVLFV